MPTAQVLAPCGLLLCASASSPQRVQTRVRTRACKGSGRLAAARSANADAALAEGMPTDHRLKVSGGSCFESV